jgi:hypothetical protein
MLEPFLFGVGIISVTLFVYSAVLFGITEDRRAETAAKVFLAIMLIDAAAALIAHYLGAF